MAVGIGVTEAKGVKSGHNIFIVPKQTEISIRIAHS